MAEAGLRECEPCPTNPDCLSIPAGKPFDAGGGPLLFDVYPDPLAVLRLLFKLVRPGGGRFCFSTNYLGRPFILGLTQRASHVGLPGDF